VNRLWLNSLKYHYSPIIAFTLSTIYAAAIALSLLYFKFDFFPLFWLIGMVIVRPLYRSGSFWMEASILLLLYLLARGDAGMPAELHRFHYYEDFSPELPGDNLVVAFPVSGWKPPWPLVSYLARKLPPGRGKPAFVLYTSAGGPENAGVVAWMILTLRGYRVAGRCWATYPMNVVTFRPGTKRMWQAIDKLTPTTGSIDEAGQFGREFAKGRQTGLPFIFWPFPLFIAGFLLDNRWTNVFLYRNRSWKRRCTRCGLCVSACPSQRLHADEEGYPRAKGTCSLCMLCINICPVNAMQMLFWSEYGQPHVPRWPELVVREKEYPIDLTV
jgi:ferredoxin